MSSGTFAATVDLALRPSARAHGILFVLHAIPLLIVLASMPPGPLMAAVGLGMFLSWLWLRRHAVFGFGPRALARVTWHADGTWTVHDSAGRATASLLGGSLVHPVLLVLNFRLEDGTRRTRVLLGDETDAEALRRLRARLSLDRPTPREG